MQRSNNYIEKTSYNSRNSFLSIKYLSTALTAASFFSSGCGLGIVYLPIEINTNTTINIQGEAPTLEVNINPLETLCDDSCNLAVNGECNDGGENSVSADCQLGTDCSDCKPR